MIKNDISGLRKNRGINFGIGLIASLSFIIMAFSFTTTPNQSKGKIGGDEPMATEEIHMPRSSHKKTPPPPTVDISDHIEPVDEVAFTEPAEPQPISIDIDEGPEPIFTEPAGYDDDEIEPDVEDPVDILIEEPVRDFAEYMPSFGTCKYNEMSKEEYKKCSDVALLQYFAQHIKYPSRARENRIEGKVIMRFVINENGDVQDAKVLRGVAGGCSEEALRVLSNMPKWKAGRHGGRNVKVNFTLPVSFKLQ
ncbi:MAG: energy transducer TonB [Saprospiraceae bacterium]